VGVGGNSSSGRTGDGCSGELGLGAGVVRFLSWKVLLPSDERNLVAAVQLGRKPSWLFEDG
jgi:hypothetical protein